MSFLLLLGIEQFVHQSSKKLNILVGAWVLTLTLSIHALITGFTLGISDTFTLVSILFIAILAHKSFEVFALIINLYRRLKNNLHLITILCIFATITPIGIFLGTLTERMISINTDNIITACFNAFAAGTFIYIGSSHQDKHHHMTSKDSYHQYTQILAMIVGICAMGILAIWI